MERLEIISVRTSGSSEQEACVYMRTFCRKVKEPLLSGAGFYSNDAIPGDLAVILVWQPAPSTEEKTDVGFSLAHALKRFGLVDHVFWIMTES